jgi:hypothetical protein
MLPLMTTERSRTIDGHKSAMAKVVHHGVTDNKKPVIGIDRSRAFRLLGNR